MGVAPVAAQDAEQHRAHDEVGTAAAIAGVVKLALAQELLPTSASLQKLEEEDQLPLASDRRLIIPLGMKTPAGSF